MNQQGQEGVGFKLIVEVVLVVFILVIIMGVISQIDEWRLKISERRLFEGFSKALNSPDGTIVFEKDIFLKKGAAYSSNAFAGTVVGIRKECIELDASPSIAFTLKNIRLVEVNNLIMASIYYKCLPGHLLGEDQCEDYCIVSFDKNLADED